MELSGDDTYIFRERTTVSRRMINGLVAAFSIVWGLGLVFFVVLLTNSHAWKDILFDAREIAHILILAVGIIFVVILWRQKKVIIYAFRRIEISGCDSQVIESGEFADGRLGERRVWPLSACWIQVCDIRLTNSGWIGSGLVLMAEGLSYVLVASKDDERVGKCAKDLPEVMQRMLIEERGVLSGFGDVWLNRKRERV
ncbi:MAG: hypothetical protein IT432_07395 [Phycisphaerales bacterium]|nr:hypothetical protein [Phycisphaerales bacterium]